MNTLTSNVRPLIQRLRARRDIPDHSANNGWRTVDPPVIELEAATKIEEQALEITQMRADLKTAQAAWNAACNAHETGALLCRHCPARFMTAWEHEVHEKEHAQKASEQRTAAEEWENAKAVMSGEMPPCECTLRDKAPSAYHNAKCPRYVADKL